MFLSVIYVQLPDSFRACNLVFFLDLFLELEEIGIKGILKTLSKYYILGIFWEDRL